MITALDLDLANYRRFTDSGAYLKKDGCVCLWQKRVEDETGIRYSINVYQWELDRVIPNFRGRTPTFNPEVHFSIKDSDNTAHVELGNTDMTIEEIEAFFDGMWRKMEFGHYERSSWYSSGNEMA